MLLHGNLCAVEHDDVDTVAAPAEKQVHALVSYYQDKLIYSELAVCSNVTIKETQTGPHAQEGLINSSSLFSVFKSILM